MENAVNIDSDARTNPDILADLEKGLDFADESIDEVYATHFMEHIDNFDFLMSEIHRVLKRGSKAYINVPFFTHADAFTDPNHKRFFTISSFMYFKDRFDMESRKLVFPTYLKPLEYIFNLHPFLQKIHEKIAFVFPAHEIRFILAKKRILEASS